MVSVSLFKKEEFAEQKVADGQDDWQTGATIDRKNGKSSSDGAVLGSWKIVIADENDEGKTIESQSKESSTRLNLWDLTNKLGLAAKRWKDNVHCNPSNEYIVDLGINAWLRGNREMENGEFVGFSNSYVARFRNHADVGHFGDQHL